jgi:hypothetical protein
MKMTPNRKLVYDFLSLPHHVKLAIGRAMNFPEPLEGKDSVVFLPWFAEARDSNRIEELRHRVTEAMPEPVPERPAPDAQRPNTINLLGYSDALAARLQYLGVSDPFYVASNAINILQELCPPNQDKALRELVAKWRESADWMTGNGSDYQSGRIGQARLCAEELESLLPRESGGQS